MDLRRKKGGTHVSDEAADCVYGKDVEGVVAADQELQLRGIVAADASENTVYDRSPRRNKARSRCDSHETGNHARTESYDGPFVLMTVVNKAPCDTCNTCSEISDHGCHYGTHVCTERTTRVESGESLAYILLVRYRQVVILPKPADPEEDGSDDDMSNVVWAIVDFLCAVTTTWA